MNLELRNRTYHVTLLVPKDVRDVIGKVRFRQSLGTGNKQVAQTKAIPFIAQWKAEIEKARGNNSYLLEATKWKEDIHKEDDPTVREAIELALTDRAEKLTKKKSLKEAQAFVGLATGTLNESNILLDKWKAQLSLAAKTKEQMIKDVEFFIEAFPTLEGITKDAVHEWAWKRIEEGKNTESSMGRVLAFSRNYWRYLQKARKVSQESNPLNIPSISRETRKDKNSVKDDNLPYSLEDVVKLYNTAKDGSWGKRAKPNQQLADLIKIAAYTGCRIEELCSLKREDVNGKSFLIREAKTGAGIREVPIHSKLKPLFERLKEDGNNKDADEYLFVGLTFNKYGDRSNAIGKTFGRMKTDLGFSDSFTFHSFRSTLITLLENAGVGENLAADIVGHKKPRITYGLYSGGASLEEKIKGIEKIDYPKL